uniref:Uncharacterized protein n=1 Tax=Ciona intestinalis TaxID=7719 RepID=H2Y070_CIOIN
YLNSFGRAIFFYRANRIRKATIRQKRPIASDNAKPRMAYVKSCCFREGFLENKVWFEYFQKG